MQGIQAAWQRSSSSSKMLVCACLLFFIVAKVKGIKMFIQKEIVIMEWMEEISYILVYKL